MKLPQVPGRVMLREDGGEWYAMNLETGNLFKLNRSAFDILSFCQRGLTVDEAVAEMSAHHQSGLDKIRPDIIKTIARFKEYGLLVETAVVETAAEGTVEGK